MAFDFPSSPTIGQVSNGYTWDGQKWTVPASGSSGTVAGAAAAFVNKFRNPIFQVWQRGTAFGSINNAYAADGWIFAPTGAAVAVSRQANARTGKLSTFAAIVVGAASVTGLVVKQRIEGMIAAPLAGQSVTVQMQVRNDTGAAITPKLTVKHAGSADNWTAPVTDVNAVDMQSCATGAWTKISATFTAHASSDLGLEISFDFGNNFSAVSKSVVLAEADCRAAAGVEAPAFREHTTELLYCQRYYWRLNSNGTANYIFMAQCYTSGGAWGSLGLLPTPMRATPTVTISGQGHLSGTNSGGTNVPFTSVVFGANGVSNQVIGPSNMLGATGLAAGNATIVNFNNASAWIDASAEL